MKTRFTCSNLKRSVSSCRLAAALVMGVATLASAQLTKGAPSTPEASTGANPKGMDQVELRVKSMQEAIKAAVAQFQKANGSADEKMARLDKVLAAINASLEEIGEKGPLYNEIDKAIKLSEAQRAKYKEKTTDANIEAKIREKYQKLADKIAANINDLYERRIVLGKARADLEKRRTSLTQEKDFIVDLITADDIASANQALLDVIASVTAVVNSIDEFAENITATPAEAATGKETR